MKKIKTKDNTWVRDNGHKPDVSLLHPDFILGTAQVMTYGTIKYDRNNYLKGDGMPSHVVYASMMRHLLAYMQGAELDEESGLPHLHHAAANLNMLIALDNKGVKPESFK